MRLIPIGLFVVAASVLSGLSPRAQAQPPEHARARLVSEQTMIFPGVKAWLAIDFEIDEGWHLYWNGTNDSGFAPKFNLKFPDGYKVGPVQWPAPQRLVQPGDILDHIYEKRITLMFPVEVPKTAETGTKIEFRASPEWLVCHTVCLPGAADVSIKLEVGDDNERPTPSADAPLFAKARERIPRPLAKEDKTVVITAGPESVVITADGAGEVFFYPAIDCVHLPNILKEGQAKGNRLALRHEVKPDATRLRGVLEIKPLKGGPPKILTVDIDVSGANKAEPGASNRDPRARGD